MAVEVGGLVARFQADTSDLQRGAQEAKGALADVGQQAQRTAAEIDATAARMAKSLGGTASEWRDILGRTGFDKVGQDAQHAATAIDQVAAATQRAATVTRAAASVSPAPVAPSVAAVASPATARARQASGATTTGGGDDAGDTNLVRFAAGIAGIGLGLSLVGGAARLIHDQIAGIIERQLDWERSTVQLRSAYGALGAQLTATAQAQANAPGLLGTGQEFASASLSAAYLSSRYGLNPSNVSLLTGSAGAASFTLGLDARARTALQGQALQFAESGGSSLREYGIEGDPLTIARRLGLNSEAGLQALTPQQLRQAQTLIASQGLYQFAQNGNGGDQPGLLARQRQAEQALTSAQSRLQNVLELPILGNSQIGVSELGEYYQRSTGAPVQATDAMRSEVDDAAKALADANKAITDNKAALDQANQELRKLGIEAGTATAALLTFTGSLEDPTSIARLDISAQAQGAIAARARMAVPAIGTTQGEIVATAQNNAYQAAYQNYVAAQAQDEQRNAIREELQRRVQFGPAAQRPAAARALEQASASEPVYERLGEAQRAGALLDFRSAETQAGLQQIALTQQERQVQLLRETLDLRRQDVQQQREGVVAQMDVIRAQQAAQAPQYALADAQYAGTRAQALARQYVGRALRGQSTAGLPSINDLINMNVNSQFDIAERTPAALESAHQVELRQRSATAIGLGQQLTEGQLQYAQLGTDLKNLGDMPSQTALMLQDIQNGRDTLAIQKEIRDLNLELVKIMTGRGQGGSTDSNRALDELINRIALEVLGGDTGNLPAMPELPGARRGPS